MSEEEEKIIRQVKTMLENATPFDMPPSRYNALKTMVNLIEKQEKEIEHYKNKYEQEQMKEQDMINQIQQLKEQIEEEYKQRLEDYYNED